MAVYNVLASDERGTVITFAIACPVSSDAAGMVRTATRLGSCMLPDSISPDSQDRGLDSGTQAWTNDTLRKGSVDSRFPAAIMMGGSRDEDGLDSQAQEGGIGL